MRLDDMYDTSGRTKECESAQGRVGKEDGLNRHYQLHSILVSSSSDSLVDISSAAADEDLFADDDYDDKGSLKGRLKTRSRRTDELMGHP